MDTQTNGHYWLEDTLLTQGYFWLTVALTSWTQQIHGQFRFMNTHRRPTWCSYCTVNVTTVRCSDIQDIPLLWGLRLSDIWLSGPAWSDFRCQTPLVVLGPAEILQEDRSVGITSKGAVSTEPFYIYPAMLSHPPHSLLSFIQQGYSIPQTASLHLHSNVTTSSTTLCII
jgi:hypothetical protein